MWKCCCNGWNFGMYYDKHISSNTLLMLTPQTHPVTTENSLSEQYAIHMTMQPLKFWSWGKEEKEKDETGEQQIHIKLNLYITKFLLYACQRHFTAWAALTMHAFLSIGARNKPKDFCSSAFVVHGHFLESRKTSLEMRSGLSVRLLNSRNSLLNNPMQGTRSNRAFHKLWIENGNISLVLSRKSSFEIWSTETK